MSLTVIIVDDERLARVELEHMLQKYDLQVLDRCSTAEQALQSIRFHKPDVVFLDINMPGQTGLEMAEEIPETVQIVFVTAYDEYALKAFDVHALDYLVKPVERHRLDKAMERCLVHKEAFAYRLAQSQSQHLPVSSERWKDHILVKDSKTTHFVNLSDVVVFNSYGNYVKICLLDKTILFHASLNDVEKKMDTKQFFRANRYTIIAIKKIEKMLPGPKSRIRCLMIDQQLIEFSDRKSALFRKTFGI